jgi:hypothetical protein
MNKEEKGKQKVRRGITITPKKKLAMKGGMECDVWQKESKL